MQRAFTWEMRLEELHLVAQDASALFGDIPAPIIINVVADQIGCLQLSKNAAPFFGAAIFANTEGFQLLMRVTFNRLCGFTRQNIDEMARHEAP